MKHFTRHRIKWMTLFLTLMTVLFATVLVHAEEQKGSVQLNYPISDVTFRLYHIGNMDGHDGYELVDAFAGYDVDLTATSAAATLADYVERDQPEPLMTGVTGEDGVLKLEGLEIGAYFMVGETKTVDDKIYVPSPVLFSVPTSNELGERTYEVELNDKFDVKPRPIDPINVSVLKVWKDDEKNTTRPKDVTVQLLENGEVYETVKLNEENNWSYEWDNLDIMQNWTVVEKDVPANYKVTVERKEVKSSALAFCVVNTYTPPTPPPHTPPELPQTGQLWWPVAILICIGLVFILAGTIRRRRVVK